MSVQRAQHEVSSAEFVEWIAYDSLEPGEPQRGDYQAALIATTIANVNRTKKGSPFKINDFLLKFEVPQKKTGAEIKTKLLAWKAMYEAGRRKHEAKGKK